ncbi:Mannosyl-3-phosphoglycerate synthase [Naviculisporaceae sp. PSN 640]
MTRIECPSPENTFQLNELSIQGAASVVEFDVSTHAHGLDDSSATFAVSANVRGDKLEQTAIIIPTKNEPVDRLVSVIKWIPGGPAIVVVSNSTRAPGNDKYKEEVEAVRRQCRVAGNRPIILIHQKDLGAGEAFEAAGEASITDGEHKIRNGKGEGMILGLAVVALFFPERRFVGFVDADNMLPASVAEYCNVFASGFYMYREQPNIMVRIQWGSKAKLTKGRLDETREGRSSVIVNKWLNKLLRRCPNGSATANKTAVMVTGNAGEHAMTMDLALQLPFAGGYAIEPYQIMVLLVWAYAGRFSATVVQIKTASMHLHNSGDDNHIRGMFLEGLGAIFHSLPSTPTAHHRHGHNGDWQAQFRAEMLEFLEQKGLGDTDPPAPRVYKPLASLDLRRMHAIMIQKCRSLEIMGKHQPGTSRGQDGHA